jgi:hypothetical protein
MENNWSDNYEVSQPAKKAAGKPPVAVRVILQLLSFVLCVSLMCAVLATTLVADLRHITSKDGIEQLVMGVLKGEQTQQQTSAIQDMLLDGVVKSLIPEEGDLADLAKEKLRDMVEQSTAMEFITEKVAGFTADFISGESTTQITVEEVLEQVEQNKELVEQYLGVEVDEAFMDKVAALVQQVDLDKLFREGFFSSFGGMDIPQSQRDDEYTEESPRNAKPNQGVGLYMMSHVEMQPYTVPNEPQSLSLNDVIATLRQVISDETFYYTVGLCAVIGIMLLLGNYYSIPGGLGWISAAVILAGALLSAPVYLVLGNPEMLTMLLEGEAIATEAVMGILSSVAPIHYTVLGIGAGFAVMSVIARIVRGAIEKKKYA